jgi:hypothetical protein
MQSIWEPITPLTKTPALSKCLCTAEEGGGPGVPDISAVTAYAPHARDQPVCHGGSLLSQDVDDSRSGGARALPQQQVRGNHAWTDNMYRGLRALYLLS